MKRSAAALLLVLLCALEMVGDDWPAARVQNVFSENGEYFVRIVPGTSLRDTVGFEGGPQGPYARGEFYARQRNRSYRLVADVELQNPISPTDALVTNSGNLITFDNWHNFGYGKIVAIYRRNGRLVRAFTAEQLYSAARLEKIPRSVSSRWWRCNPRGFVDPDKQTEIFVSEYFGGTFTFKVDSGTMGYHTGRAECQPPPGPFSASWFGR